MWLGRLERSLGGLFAYVGVGLGAPRDEALAWLHEEGLWPELTSSERELFDTPEATKQQLTDASWKSESLMVLLWALNKFDDLPPSNEQCNTSLFQDYLPPFTDSSVEDFIGSATRRDDDTLLRKTDEILDLHWQARDARHRGQSKLANIDMEIIQERHHAINWVTGYEGLAWDEVTTDT